MTMKLRAEDENDLAVLSASVQDAIIRVGDIRFDPVGRSLSLRLSRFMHELDTPMRIEAGLRFDSVMRVQSAGFDRSNPDAFAVVLGLSFEVLDNPDGLVTINLAGGGALRLNVECLDVLLADMGEPRRTASQPAHDLS